MTQSLDMAVLSIASLLFWSLLLITKSSLVGAQNEILANSDFETDLSHWSCSGCKVKRVHSGMNGGYAAKITNRVASWSLFGSMVPIKPNSYYYFTIHVNVLPGEKVTKPYYRVESLIILYNLDGSKDYRVMGYTNRIQPGTGFRKVGGDIFTYTDATKAKLYIRIKELEVDYMVDEGSFTEFIQNPNWRQDADTNIEKYRKSDFDIKLQGRCDDKDYRLTLKEEKFHFAFGACVKGAMMLQPKYEVYQHFIYKNFNWAVLENALKWYRNEPVRGKLDLSIAKKAIPLLRKHGVTMRGHTVFWGLNNLYPQWLKKLSPAEVMNALDYRINHAVKYFGHEISQWDVNNENLKGDEYEKLTGDPNITTVMFKKVYNAVPGIELFLNDNSILAYRKNTVAITDQAKLLQQGGAPIYGIGIQSHFFRPPDVTLLKRRLDEVAKAGLPIFITEMTYETPDFANRTAHYDDMLRVYFSHPAVHGIFFWVISNNGWRPDAAMLNSKFEPNPLGKRYLELRRTWSTPYLTHNLKNGDTILRAFHGDYRLTLEENGKEVYDTIVHLREDKQKIVINLSECKSKVPDVNIIG